MKSYVLGFTFYEDYPGERILQMGQSASRGIGQDAAAIVQGLDGDGWVSRGSLRGAKH